MKIAYLDCFSGISGDMVLGAFLDAGLGKKTLERELGKLGLGGCRFSARKGNRGGLAGTKFNVTITTASPPHRRLKDILKLMDQSLLAPAVKRTASAIFDRLSRAEAAVHGTTPDEVHFHEVGAIDSIVDIVGAAVAIDELGIEEVTCSPVALGSGFVTCEHGVMPVPVPAVVELLRGKPTVGTDVPAELTTPTGAAIAVTLCKNFGEMPPMELAGVGTGLGSRDHPQRPNALRIFLGSETAPAESDRIVELEANIDDMTPQAIGHLFDRFFQAGALDVYTTPIQMKKNRPAVKLAVMAPPDRLGAMERIFLDESSSFGVRVRTTQRLKLSREVPSVATRWGEVPVVAGRRGGRLVKVVPEYESCRAIAEKRGIPLAKVYDEVMAARIINQPGVFPADTKRRTKNHRESGRTGGRRKKE